MTRTADTFLRSTTGRLAAAISILVFTIAAFIALYFPVRSAHRAEAALREKADAVSRLTATRLEPALVFSDRTEAQQSLIAASQTTDFVAGTVADSTGAPIATVAPVNPLDTDTFGVSTPINHDGIRIGTVHLRFSRVAVRAEAREQWRHVLLISTVILLLGMLAALAIGRTISASFREIGAAADRIASGDLTTRARATSTDEGDQLVAAFNAMMDRLQAAQSDLANANQGLEARVEERTRDLRHTTRQLGIERDRAEEGSRSKSRFLATMSHEIRTPLNGILGMAGLLIDSPLNPTQRDCAETLRNSGDALLTIIDDILDFSKIEAGRLDLEQIEYDLHPIIEDVVDLVGVRVGERGIELATCIDAGAPLRLYGDPGRVRQVLLNLIGNAIKFTASGEVLLHVRTDGDAMVRIEVRDTGVGLTEESRTRLFQPFVQADGSTTRRYGGTGLGLAICRQLVELMGGTIGVESTVGEGSTFWFTLPSPVPRIVPPPAPVAQWQVLIVDDHRPTVAMAAALLAPAGIGAVQRFDAISAFAVFDDVKVPRPTLMLLDDRLPGAEELALLAQQERMPVLWLSARTQAGDHQPHVPKPLRSSVLLRGIEHALNGTTPAAILPSGTPEPIPGVPVRRLLLVEDNSVNQKVARMLLERLGWRVDVAGDGKEAVDAVCQLPYDLVLMDCQMPVMDGFDATRALRAREASLGLPRMPIIALTANAMHGDREACLASGMDDFVSKPIQPQLLAEAITRLVPAGSAGAAAAAGPAPNGAVAPAVRTSGEATYAILDRYALSALRELEVESGVAVVRDILGEYLQQLEPRLTTIGAGAKAGDWNLVSREAHALKGSSGSLGATALYQLCAEIEQVAKAGDGAAVMRLLPGLEHLGEQTQHQMEAELSGEPAG